MSIGLLNHHAKKLEARSVVVMMDLDQNLFPLTEPEWHSYGRYGQVQVVGIPPSDREPPDVGLTRIH